MKPKEIQLIHRTNSFNLSPEKFHKNCDNINHTLVLIKTIDDKIIGGYTPLLWNASSRNI